MFMKKKKKVIIGVLSIVGIIGVIFLAISLFLHFNPYFMRSGRYKVYQLYYEDFEEFKEEYDRYYDRYIKNVGSEDEHIDLKKYEFENVLSCTYKIWGICGCNKAHQTKNENCKTLRYVEAYIDVNIDEKNKFSIHYLYTEEKTNTYIIYSLHDYENKFNKQADPFSYDYVVADELTGSLILSIEYHNIYNNGIYEGKFGLDKEIWNQKILDEVNKKIE